MPTESNESPPRRPFEGHQKQIADLKTALLESDEKFRALTDSAPVGIFLNDAQGNTIYVNRKCAELVGVPAEEALNFDWIPCLHPDDRERMVSEWEKAFKNSTEFHLEYRWVHADGNIVWTLGEVIPILGDDGKAIQFIGTLTDITDRKQAEEALREGETKYRYLYETMAQGIVLQDNEGRILEANRAAQEILGLSMDQMLGRTPYDPRWKLIQEDGSPYNPDEMPSNIALRTGKPTKDVFCGVYVPEQDEYRWIIINSAPQFRDGETTPFLTMTVFTDITDRKLAEEELRKSELKYRQVFETNKAIKLMIDPEDGTIVEANEAACNFYGYSKRKMMTMKIMDINALPSEKIHLEMQKARSEERLFFRFSHRLASGEVRDVEVYSGPVNLGEKTILYSIIHDITDRVNAEKALVNQKELLQKAQEIGQIGTWELNTEKNELLWTDENYRIFGLPVGTKLTYETFLNCVHPDDREYVDREWKAGVEGKPYDIEHRLLLDGEVKWVREKADLEFDENGNAVSAIGFTQDITERKIAETKLKKSEEKYRLIAENMADVITTLGMDLNFTYVSPSIINLRGFTVEEAMKQKIDQIMTPESFKRLSKAITEELSLEQTGTADPDRCRIIELEEYKKDGSTIWVENTASFIRNSDQKPVGMLVISRDITERKRGEEALRESEDFLNRTGDMAQVGGWEVDLETMKVVWTRTTGRIHELPHGYFPDLEEAISYYHPEDQDHVRQCVQRAIESSEPFDFTVRLITAKGRERWVRALGQPIFDSGSCVRLSGTFQDITERKKAEEALSQSHKMEAIGTLAGGIAHEFNNVLGIILGNAELAMDDVPDWNPAKESLKEIRTASFRAKEVVRQILSFARKTMTSLKPLEINTIVKESLKLMRASIPAMVDIQQKIPGKPSTILGDPTEIHQIVINLCANAAHAVKDTGGVLEVGISEVTLDEKTASRFEDLSAGDFVKLTVKDSGEGIAPEILEKVFEPYFTTKEFGAGSGMGMAVVYGIVKKCEGAIRIDSTVGEGTTVEVLFPKIEVEALAKEKKEVELPRGNERILLVDDDPSIVTMICQMLERFGYKVTSMTDSTTALERFKSAPDDFDLVITDMSMPKMSGDQLAAELIKVRENVPILLCTGHSDTVDEKKAKEIGVKGFAMKPLDMGKLATAVRAVLDG